MKFGNHLFISYAHLDNEKAEKEDLGWVDRFHQSLKAFLTQAIGEEAVIWRDPKLRKSDVFADEIVRQFPQTALLVSILSPRYLKSEWCLKEIEEFCRVAEAHGGLVIDNKMRAHRVMLVPITAELRKKLPGRLEDELGYRFYAEEEGERYLTLDPRFGEKYKAAFNREIALMANELAEIIVKLAEDKKAASEQGPAESKDRSKPVIYLAECSWDRCDDRDKIRGELRATGYTVLPDPGTGLPELETDYVAEVERLLDQSQLSIHVVGAHVGKVPNGPGRKDAVQLQNEIAARKNLLRLIWLPETTSPQPEQQSFIDALRSKAELQRGGDLIEDNLEGFKNALRVSLKRLEEGTPSKKTQPAESQGKRIIHLLCVPADREATVPLRRYLKQQGLDVQLPVFEGDAAAIDQANQDLLIGSDAVLIFYGTGSEAWKRTVDNRLDKSRSCHPRGASLIRFTYSAPPLTEHKKDLIDMGEEYLINGTDGFSESAIKPFIDAVNTLK